MRIDTPTSFAEYKAKRLWCKKNTELIQRFKEVDTLPEEEQGVLIKIIAAYVRDYRAKQAYAM